jgi:hypothetical protein
MADLRTFVLAARKSLIEDIQEQLIQLYGLKSTGEFLSEGQIPALTRGESSSELLETYRRLKQLLNDEREAGIDPVSAIAKLCKEVAFTHLNRLVALKLLEGRKLIRGAINNWHNSNAFLFYLAEHDVDKRLFEQGSQPTDDRGEGPSDRAYRHFLSWQYGKLADEVKVLFDPDNIASRLFPRPLVLRSLLNDLNGDELKDYWGPGNEETVGWVYQFFNAEEKEEAFGRVFKKKQKFKNEDIAAATQIFTPRWIVEFLVQNSLGRFWATMHPESRLIDEMLSLVPLPLEPRRSALKAAKDIRVLDPATGTMHFGLVAFDWLVKMYREELANVGQPGWPTVASVESDEEIPGFILANNLFGIDIDLRAVQLSALSLYLRAKQTNKNAQVIESNLACTDIAIFRGQHLTKIALELQLPNSVTRQLFSTFCESVVEASQMGSLVRLEAHFQNMEAGRLREIIDDYVAKKAAAGEDESYFGNESRKGLRLLDIMSRRYDVVFTNPPYMSTRNMNPAMSDFMKRNYRKSKGDLYAAFIERCTEMLNDGGRMAMVTQQSFMFISSFEKLRDLLLQNTVIETMAHTGAHAFEEVTGEKVNTTVFVVRRQTLGDMSQKSVGVYIRLVGEPNATRKRLGCGEALSHLRQGEADLRVYRYDQRDFSAVVGKPFSYQLSKSLRVLFRLPLLDRSLPTKHGLTSGNNRRFIRMWWELGVSRISRESKDRSGALSNKGTWFPLVKSASKGRWVGLHHEVLNYFAQGKELIASRIDGTNPGHRHDNPDTFFRSGVAFPLLSSKGMTARIVPPGFIYDVSSPFVVTNEAETVCAYLNSSLASYLLAVLNPTLNFPPGDVGRLPYKPEASRGMQLLVTEVASLMREAIAENETTYEFCAPPSWIDGQSTVDNRRRKIESLEKEIDEEIFALYGISDEDRAVITGALSGPMEAEGAEPEPDEEREEEVEVVDDLVQSLSGEELSKQWLSYAVGVALGRYSPGVDGALGRGSFSKEISQQLGGLSNSNGIMVVERGHPDDLAQRVWDILRVVHGDAGAEEIIRQAIDSSDELRESLAGYLVGAFFKDHVRLYRKRPIYWLLQSPKRTFNAYMLHERATPNTIATLQGNGYLGGHLHRTESELTDLVSRAAKAGGIEKADLIKRARALSEMIEDLKAFDSRLTAVGQFSITDQHGIPKTVRWEPELDDGVLLNAAPLHELMPAWKKVDAKLDLKKTWIELETGKYDWAKTAMRYWPARVLKACKENKSFAIAHRLD